MLRSVFESCSLSHFAGFSFSLFALCTRPRPSLAARPVFDIYFLPTLRLIGSSRPVLRTTLSPLRWLLVSIAFCLRPHPSRRRPPRTRHEFRFVLVSVSVSDGCSDTKGTAARFLVSRWDVPRKRTCNKERIPLKAPILQTLFPAQSSLRPRRRHLRRESIGASLQILQEESLIRHGRQRVQFARSDCPRSVCDCGDREKDVCCFRILDETSFSFVAATELLMSKYFNPSACSSF